MIKITDSVNLSKKQIAQLIEIFEDMNIPGEMKMLTDKYWSFECEVALDDDDIVVDVRIFDPEHQFTTSWYLHTDYNGWSDWLCGVYEEE